MSTVSKEAYETADALAAQMHEGWRDLYAELLRSMIVSSEARQGARRWLRDAGYGTVHNYEVGS